MGDALEHLNVGDKAYTRTSDGPLAEVTIVRAPRTLVVDNLGDTYRRSDGRSTEKGTRWGGRTYLYPPTPELDSQYQRQENLSLVRMCDWNKRSNKALAKVAEILREDEDKKEEEHG